MKFTVSTAFHVVRACVTLDQPMHWSDQFCPFTVMSPTGLPLETQWEGVSRDALGLVRVAEFIAINSDLEVGEFRVVMNGGARDKMAHPLQFARNWIDSAPTFLLDGNPMSTVFDEAFACSGPCMLKRRFQGPSFVGWVTVFDGLDIVDVLIDFNQGDLRSPDLPFGELVLTGAPAFETFIPEPDVSIHAGGAIALVSPRPDGLLHGLPQRLGRPWRMVLHDGTRQAQARAYADGAAQGFAVEGWRMGGYGAQDVGLPDLTTKLAEIHATLGALWGKTRNAIEHGLTIGIGVTEGQPGGKLDWLHPWGTQDGGTTSGSWRWIYDRVGVMTACSGDYNGIRELLARSTLIAQRMPMLILDEGKPALLEQFLTSGGAPVQGWRMSASDAHFDGNTPLDAPFGYHAALLAHPTPTNMAPEFSQILKFHEINWQHFDRAYSSLIALAFLTNDSWAKWRMRCYAECWRMTMFSGARMQSERSRVLSNPGHGTQWGRAHGECWTLAAHVFATSPEVVRTRFANELNAAVDLVVKAQMPNGCVRASMATIKDNAQFPGCFDPVHNVPLYQVTKFTEEAQLLNFVACILGAMASINRQPMIDALSKWCDALQQFVGARFPDWCAVAPPVFGAQPYVGTSPLEYGHDKSEVGAPMGFALLHSPSDLSAHDVLRRAYTASNNPLQAMLAKKLDAEPGVDDQAPLIAGLQHP